MGWVIAVGTEVVVDRPLLAPWLRGSRDRSLGCRSVVRVCLHPHQGRGVHGGKLGLPEGIGGLVLTYAPGGGCHYPTPYSDEQFVVLLLPTPGACLCWQ